MMNLTEEIQIDSVWRETRYPPDMPMLKNAGWIEAFCDD